MPPKLRTNSDVKEKAKIESLIDWNAFQEILPAADKQPDTELRRQSVNASSHLLTGHLTGHPQQGQDFDDFVKLNTLSYSCDWDTVRDDVQNKATELAVRYITKATKENTTSAPGFHFKAFCNTNTAENKLPFQGTIDQDGLTALSQKHPNELWKEDKIRNLTMVSLYIALCEMHNIAKSVSVNQKVIVEWVKHIQNLRLIEKAERGDTDQTTEAQLDDLLAEIEDRDTQIKERDSQILELLNENRTLAKKLATLPQVPATPTGQTAQTPATPLSRVRFNLSNAGRNVIHNRLTTPSPGTGRAFSETGGSVVDTGKRSSKIDGPPLWDGDAKTSKVSFEGWFRALENKLIINRDHFDNDAAMMGYVENRLTGDALEALLPYLSDDHPDKLDTLDALLVWLQSEYVDQTAKQKARKAYQKLLEPAGPEEMKILVTQGNCFNCRKHGHTTRDCPDKHLYRPPGRAKMTDSRIQEIIDKYHPPDSEADTPEGSSDEEQSPEN